MSSLQVPGAELSFHTVGDGPPVVLVPGASGTGRIFTRLQTHLAASYTVTSYDRRGFSDSRLDGPQDYTHRLGTDADELQRLIDHTSGGSAHVFATSSGAVIALHLLSHHADAIETLVAAEPAAMRLLADGQQWIDFFHHVYQTYQHAGIKPALDEFRERTFTSTDRDAMAKASDHTNPEQQADASYWFEHELRQYPAVRLNLSLLRQHAAKIIPAAGRASPGYPTYQAAAHLGDELGRSLTDLPGGHIGFATQPEAFAHELLQLLPK